MRATFRFEPTSLSTRPLEPPPLILFHTEALDDFVPDNRLLEGMRDFGEVLLTPKAHSPHMPSEKNCYEKDRRADDE